MVCRGGAGNNLHARRFFYFFLYLLIAPSARHWQWAVYRARYVQSGYVEAQLTPGSDTIDSLRFQSVLPRLPPLCVLFPAGILSLAHIRMFRGLEI
jgi:hypothetical protein